MVPFIYTKGPRFIKGNAISLAMVVTGTTIHCILWVSFGLWFSVSPFPDVLQSQQYSYRLANERRRAGKENWKMEGKTDEEIEEMGDESPRFVYTE